MPWHTSEDDPFWIECRNYTRDNESIDDPRVVVLGTMDMSIFRALERDPAYMQRKADAIRAAYASPEQRAMVSRRNTEINARPEVKAKIRKGVSDYCKTPEGYAQRQATTKASWDDPVIRQRRSDGIRATLARKRAERIAQQ